MQRSLTDQLFNTLEEGIDFWTNLLPEDDRNFPNITGFREDELVDIKSFFERLTATAEYKKSEGKLISP
ncbi:MAG: hypothetical protein H7A38_03490 [Chlamydiales bacterium]|nr:hypothetical protein [Chlamydiales bacterium]